MSKFYVLNVVDLKVEHWFSNDPKKIKEIYETEKWMHTKDTNMFRVEAGKKGQVDISKLKKVYDTDLSNVHICKDCYIFYLSKQTCTECNKEAVKPD